ncbi:hypothetical protein, partial [Klebsiella pneumoniae]|uniref:hypothetical protein n=1 Tax=Klebsiella pneumoniae TaxID=573 RepID=UPI0030135F9F
MQNLDFDQSEEDQLRKACQHAMLAIGAQTRASDDDRCENYHFMEAQTAAVAILAEDPTVDTVRVFLLLGFYLLGADRRNG